MNQNLDARISVTVLYPTDPLSVAPGGIDTFIRGQLKYCPEDIRYSVIGMSSDIAQRSVGKWQTLQIGSRNFRFLPVMENVNKGSAFLPATIRYMLALARLQILASHECDVFETHRMEPLLLTRKYPKTKVLFVHQNMQDLYRPGGDIGWRHFPRLYFSIENRVLKQANRIFCVREDAADDYRNRFPTMSQSIEFVPTWADPDLFYPVSDEKRRSERKDILSAFGWPAGSTVVSSVGRLDGQKNPQLLLESFFHNTATDPNLRLLLIGDGPMRRELESAISQSGFARRVKLCGIMRPTEVARILRCSDMFAMSSRYEGMPMAVVEALACGLPVVATRVGEIERVVKPGVCGELASLDSAQSFCDAFKTCKDKIESYRGTPCTTAVERYTPSRVLKPIFDYYRDQAGHYA